MVTARDYTPNGSQHPGLGNSTPIPYSMGGLRTETVVLNLVGHTDSDTYTVLDVAAGETIVAAFLTVLEKANEACDVDFGYSSDDIFDGADIYQAVGTTVAAGGAEVNEFQASATEVTGIINNVAAALTAGKIALTFVINGK